MKDEYHNRNLAYCKCCMEQYCMNCAESSHYKGWKDFCSEDCTKQYKIDMKNQKGRNV